MTVINEWDYLQYWVQERYLARVAECHDEVERHHAHQQRLRAIEIIERLQLDSQLRAQGKSLAQIWEQPQPSRSLPDDEF